MSQHCRSTCLTQEKWSLFVWLTHHFQRSSIQFASEVHYSFAQALSINFPLSSTSEWSTIYLIHISFTTNSPLIEEFKAQMFFNWDAFELLSTSNPCLSTLFSYLQSHSFGTFAQIIDRKGCQLAKIVFLLFPKLKFSWSWSSLFGCSILKMFPIGRQGKSQTKQYHLSWCLLRQNLNVAHWMHFSLMKLPFTQKKCHSNYFHLSFSEVSFRLK